MFLTIAFTAASAGEWSGAGLTAGGHNIEYTIRVGTRDPGGDVIRRGTHDSWPPTRKNITDMSESFF